MPAEVRRVWHICSTFKAPMLPLFYSLWSISISIDSTKRRGTLIWCLSRRMCHSSIAIQTIGTSTYFNFCLYFVCSVHFILFAVCILFCLQCAFYFVCSVHFILLAVYLFCLQWIAFCLLWIAFCLLCVAFVCNTYSVCSGVPSGPPYKCSDAAHEDRGWCIYINKYINKLDARFGSHSISRVRD